MGIGYLGADRGPNSPAEFKGGFPIGRMAEETCKEDFRIGGLGGREENRSIHEQGNHLWVEARVKGCDGLGLSGAQAENSIGESAERAFCSGHPAMKACMQFSGKADGAPIGL